jgi:hypothetical protein
LSTNEPPNKPPERQGAYGGQTPDTAAAGDPELNNTKSWVLTSTLTTLFADEELSIRLFWFLCVMFRTKLQQNTEVARLG